MTLKGEAGGRGWGMAANGDEPAALEDPQRCLYRSFCQSGAVSHHLQARDGGAAAAGGLSPNLEIKDESGRAAIVADEVGHECIDHVCVERDAVSGGHIAVDAIASAATQKPPSTFSRTSGQGRFWT
jgi:hypothetical protein